MPGNEPGDNKVGKETGIEEDRDIEPGYFLCGCRDGA